jgi:hypothetical protein
VGNAFIAFPGIGPVLDAAPEVAALKNIEHQILGSMKGKRGENDEEECE